MSYNDVELTSPLSYCSFYLPTAEANCRLAQYTSPNKQKVIKKNLFQVIKKIYDDDLTDGKT